MIKVPSFKEFVENMTQMGSTVDVGSRGVFSDINSDPFVADNADFLNAFRSVRQRRARFAWLRASMQRGTILAAFDEALRKHGLPTNGKPVFSPEHKDYLNDQVQAWLVKELGIPFDGIENYCRPYMQDMIAYYKQNFLDPHDKHSWDYQDNDDTSGFFAGNISQKPNSNPNQLLAPPMGQTPPMNQQSSKVDLAPTGAYVPGQVDPNDLKRTKPVSYSQRLNRPA